MAYRTRSNTMKLQRLIDYLRDQGSDLASNLEASAAVFFDDVKPKTKPPLHLLYDSDSGSSLCEEKVKKIYILAVRIKPINFHLKSVSCL